MPVPHPTSRTREPGPIPARSPASLNVPGCPTKCDDCTFPAIETDTRLFSWPEIEDQMWDTDTKIDKVLSGSYPVAAGGSITLEQEARRTLTWIPDVVEISTTWSGGNPQPGFLKYQWATGPRGSLVGQVQFSNPQLGTQYECGEDRTCKRVRFPTYKGCNNIAIGALSSLRLIVTLDGSATSVLEKVQVTAYHRKACCDACATGKSCSCG